jgi:hypothetical protein
LTRAALLGAVALTATLAQRPAPRLAADPLLWLILRPAEDSRPEEMARFDDEMDEQLVAALDASPELRGRMQSTRKPLVGALESKAAFASLHFDPLRPMRLTEGEKKVIEDYLSRGGFLLLVENNYPYTESEYRRKVEGTLFDYFFVELSLRNPQFTVDRIGADHPVFHQAYRIEYPEFILREIFENSNYRGETVFLHRGRLVGYALSLYAFPGPDGHVPLSPPYSHYDLIETGYRLLVNIYLYALQH